MRCICGEKISKLKRSHYAVLNTNDGESKIPVCKKCAKILNRVCDFNEGKIDDEDDM